MITRTVIETRRELCDRGNYYKIERVHILSDDYRIYCKILEKTTDQYEVLTFTNGEFRLEDEEGAENIVTLDGYPIRFRKGEAKIVVQNPEGFIEARKRHAKHLATKEVL